MASIPFIILDSLVYASWLFMVASGLTLIYGVMKVLNVAHGSLYAFGAYANAWLIGWYFNNYTEFEALSFLFIPISALVIGVILGVLIEKFFLRKIYFRDEIVVVLVTYGLFLIFEDVMKLIFGTTSYLPYQPRMLLGNINVFSIPYVVYDLAIIGIAALIWFLFNFIIKYTKIGKLLLSVINDREMSSAL